MPLLGTLGMGGGIGSNLSSFTTPGDPTYSTTIPYGLDQSSSGNTDYLNRNYTASTSGEEHGLLPLGLKRYKFNTLVTRCFRY